MPSTASAYTANLASFMVSRNAASHTVINMEDIVKKKKTICIWRDSVHHDFLLKHYPKLAREDRVFLKIDPFEVLLGLKNDECEFALTGKQHFEDHENNSYLNSECSLTWVGEIVHSIPAGFTTAIDTFENCTSLISYVLDLHLNEMKSVEDAGEDPKFEKILQHRREKQENSTDVCKERSTSHQIETSMSLSIDDTGGIFLLHVIFSMASICLALGQYLSDHRNKIIESENPSRISRRPFVRHSIWVPRQIPPPPTRNHDAQSTQSIVSRRNKGTSPSVSNADIDNENELSFLSESAQGANNQQVLKSDGSDDDSLLSFDDFDRKA